MEISPKTLLPCIVASHIDFGKHMFWKCFVSSDCEKQTRTSLFTATYRNLTDSWGQYNIISSRTEEYQP